MEHNPELKCVICQSPLKTGKKYCSQACFHKEPSRIKGAAHPSWKGGRYRTEGGYIRVHFGGGKQKLLHRLIVEQNLGRELTDNEIVHHKNGIKDDNRLENLEVVLRTTHFGHVTCPRCRFDFKIK